MGKPAYVAPAEPTPGRHSFTPGVEAAITVSGLTGKGQAAAGAFAVASAMSMPGKTFGGGRDGLPITKDNPAFIKPKPFSWLLLAVPPALGVWWAVWADAGIFVNIGMPLLGGLVSLLWFYVVCRTNRKEVQMLCGLWVGAAGVLDSVLGSSGSTKTAAEGVAGAAGGAAVGAWRNPHGGSLNDDGTIHGPNGEHLRPGGRPAYQQSYDPMRRQSQPRFVPADLYPESTVRHGWRYGPQGQNMNDPANWPSGYERPVKAAGFYGGTIYRYADGTTYDARRGR